MTAPSDAVDGTLGRLGQVGVWLGTPLGGAPAATARALAGAVERLGYGVLWIGEAPGHREVFTHAQLLLAATDRLVVAAGIANIRVRDPLAMNAAASTVTEAHPGRFVLGMGTGHPALLGRSAAGDSPLALMRGYLDALDGSAMTAPALQVATPRLLAALRPAMQRLARDRTSGVHTFSVTPEHTAATRERVGDGAFVAPEQAIVLDSSPADARAKARAHVRTRLAMPNYVGSFRAMGFGDDDLAGEGSDRLVDSIVAWGDPDQVAARVRAHLDAGADHVAVHPVAADPKVIEDELAALSPLLTRSAPAARHEIEEVPK